MIEVGLVRVEGRVVSADKRVEGVRNALNQ